MATVFMKYLETSPGDYDRGIQIVSLGRIRAVKERIARDYVGENDRVLEIGCGTGELAVLCARRGARVVGVDAAPGMLDVARQRVEEAELGDQVELHLMDASAIGDHFSPGSFDVVVSTLVFSELDETVQGYVLRVCASLLAPGGRLVIADEVVPPGLGARLVFYAVRWPLVLLTWLLTRTSTLAVTGLPGKLAAAGLRGQVVDTYLGGSLALVVARPAGEAAPPAPHEIPRLVHRTTLRTVLTDAFCLLWRNFPPYPKVRPGLYAIGQPGRDAPVLVTGNYDLTVRRVVRDTRGLDAYLLVCDSRGINVWCAAGGGHFSAEKVIQAVNTSGVAQAVDHRTLILPQMAACGVQGRRVEEETGWHVRWGPMYAADIAAYLRANCRKADTQREARFPLGHRMEMAAVIWQVWAVGFGVATFIFARDLFWPTLALSWLLFAFTGAFLHWIPGRNGFWKGVLLAVGSVGLFLVWTAVTGQPVLSIATANASLGLAALALFVGTDYQGGSPLQRGGEFEHILKLVPLELLLMATWLALTFWPR